MKKLRQLLTLLIVLLTACEQDVYDKGDATYSHMRADFVEAYSTADRSVTYVVTDDDQRLTLKAPFTAKWLKADTTYRAVLYYNLVGTEVEALNISQITTVPVKHHSLLKTAVKTDPVGFESAWLSANGKYLNLGLVVKLGAVDSLTQKQSVGIVGDTILTHGDGRRTYQLRLYHNQGDVPEYYSQRVYISVPVDTLDVDSLQLSVNTYSGVLTKRFKHTLKHH